MWQTPFKFRMSIYPIPISRLILSLQKFPPQKKQAPKQHTDFPPAKTPCWQTKHLRSAVAEGLDNFQRDLSDWGGQSHDWSPGKVGVGLLNAHGIQ